MQQRTHSEIRRRLLHAAQALSCTRAMKDNIVTTNEERLSITLEVLESKQQCDTMFPHLILNTFYEGVQCDAHELLMRLLAMESRKTRQLAKRIARRLAGKKPCTKPGKKDPGKKNPEKKDPGMKDMTTGNNHGEKIPGKEDPAKKNGSKPGKKDPEKKNGQRNPGRENDRNHGKNNGGRKKRGKTRMKTRT